MSNFVSNENMTSIMTGIAQKFASIGVALTYRGTVTFENLPSTLTEAMTGYMYNVSNDFTTDSRFVEGAGKQVKAGTNVIIANVGDASIPDMKFDAEGTFEDFSYIANMIAGEFNDSTAYAEGAVVIHEGRLYKFTSAHSAGAWNSSEVAQTTVVELIASGGGGGSYTLPIASASTLGGVKVGASLSINASTGELNADSLTTAQINALLALLD